MCKNTSVEHALLATTLVLLMAATITAAEDRADSDGDGILDRHEAALGTDPGVPQSLCRILDDGPESEQRRARPGYDASKDVVAVDFCHVGDDRYLWRVTLVAEPHLEDTVLHLYVDADAEENTGRKGPERAASTGTEYMLTVAGAQERSTHYNADGNHAPQVPLSYVVDGRTVWITADIDLGRVEQTVHYALYVLCHDITKPDQKTTMSDSTVKQLVKGVPLSNAPKVMRPHDYMENHGVSATFGLDLLRRVLADQQTLVVSHDKLQLDGFVVDLQTSRRFPHLRCERPDAKAWTPAPQAGRYHVGFMMYDDSSSERVALFIDDEFQGVAVANQDNNRWWLYWLDQPRSFQGGERIELRAVSPGGRLPIANVLFLPNPPEVRKIEYRVENMVSAAHVGEPGRVTVSWTTTWPCLTRFEYGPTTEYSKAVENDVPCLVHRVVLEGLDPSQEYHGRATCTARDGTRFQGDDVCFRAASPAVPPTLAEVASIPLSVRNPYPFAVKDWPVTTGIPFPEGKLAGTEQVRLVGPDDEELPAQFQVTGRWGDGSVKWILVTFTAGLAVEAESRYRLEFGREVRRAEIDEPVSAVKDSGGVVLDSGALRLRIDSHGNLTDARLGDRTVLPADTACETLGRDLSNNRYTTSTGEAQLAIEEAGPIRAVVKVTSHLATAEGGTLLAIEKRIEAYRNAPWVRIHHTFVVNNQPKFTDLKQLTYRVPLPGRTWELALSDGKSIALDAATDRIWQRFDDELVAWTDGQQTPATAQLVGSAVSSGDSPVTVAVRDGWQNYPKGFRLAPEGLDIELCPAFEPGLYDKFPFEKEGHHLYYYLLDGRYRLKQGVAKTHEMLLCFAPAEEAQQLAALFQRPLLATADPSWYCASKAFYDVAPRDPQRFKLYEEAVDKNIAAYRDERRRRRDFGILNFGDWYGERGTNWGNIEYDTQHAFFLEYIRSGNPDAFFLGCDTELHNRDVDTVQWSPTPHQVGAVYIHQMCHVGEYYQEPVPGSLGFPKGGYTVSHAWTEGHFDHYFLTGDRRSCEAGCAVADFFIRKQLGRPYDFTTCRVPGWHLIMLASAYAATGDPYYLNAAKLVAERVLETQDTQPRPLPEYQRAGRKPFQLGGWSRMMVPGHCRCEPRHRGNAGFMVAVLLSGLKYYYDVTGDPRVKQAIIQGAHYLCEECYSDETHGFRYTSCPATRYTSGASPLMVEGIARAYLWTKDERFRRVLTEALPRGAHGSRYGKSFSMYYRMAPRVLADLSAAGLTLNESPTADR